MSFATPIVGVARCFACGWLAGCALRAVRRPALSFGLTGDVRPAGLGAALATLCATWHGAMLSLRSLGRPRQLPLRASIAGAAAGALTCAVRPDEVAPRSALHAGVVLSAALSAGRPEPSQSRPCRGRSRWREHAHAAATTAAACLALWHLLDSYAAEAATAAQRAAAAVAAIQPLEPPSAVAEAVEARALEFLAAPPPLGSPVLASVAVQAACRAQADGARRGSAGSTALAAAAGWADGTRLGLCRAVPASVVQSVGAWRRRPRQMLSRVLRAAAARACLGGLSAALLHVGGGACHRIGWAAGLGVLSLHPAARLEVASWLSYRALTSLAPAAPRGVARACSAAVFSVSAAHLMGEYARRLTVPGSGGGGGGGPARGTLSSSAEHAAVHFLAGFDGFDGRERGRGESATK